MFNDIRMVIHMGSHKVKRFWQLERRNRMVTLLWQLERHNRMVKQLWRLERELWLQLVPCERQH